VYLQILDLCCAVLCTPVTPFLMDKYLVKTLREAPKSAISAPAVKPIRQSTLHSLPGVVVLEEIEEANEILQSEHVGEEKKIDILKGLRKKRPAKEILVRVGIGRTVRKLSKLESASSLLRELSGQVYKAWREHIEETVERGNKSVQVQSDTETDRLRTAATKFVCHSLYSEKQKLTPKQKYLVESIEKEVFVRSNKLVNKNYRQLSRKIVFALQHKTEFREAVISGQVSVKQLVAGYFVE